jgi:DNA repair exonuclease SbcCD ATPase subunit
MKITYAKFVNFAGIYAGLAAKELELDFTKGKNKIVMLLGGNGAGKTTVLSLLNPYRDTNDERSDNYILLNHHGEKIIHLTEGEDKYVIHHLYKKVDDEGKATGHNKSFISKNGVELNENGGIRTFEDTLLNEMNLNRDYFRIARLGSNVTTFIDLKTAERKKYINNFLPDIDDYLEAFENVNDKFKKMKNSIDSIKNQLDKLDTKDNLTELENTLNETIDKMNEDISKLEKLIDRSEVKIQDLTNSLDLGEESDYKKFMSILSGNISALENELVRQTATIEAYFSKYPNLKEYDSKRIEEATLEYNKGIITAEGNIKQIVESIDSIEKEIIRLRNDKASKENVIKNEVDISYIEKQIKVKEEAVENYNLIIAESDYKDVQLTVQEVASHYSLMQNIISKFESVHAKRSNSVIEDFKPSYFQSVPRDLESMRTKLQKFKEDKRRIESSISSIESNSYLLDTLEKRPSDCVIDTCPFIVKAVDYKNNDYSKLDGLHSELDEISKEIPIYEEEISVAEEIAEFIEDLNGLLEYIDNDVVRQFVLSDVDMNHIIRIVKKDISFIQKFFDISDLVKVVNTMVDLKTEQDKLESLYSHLELAKSQKAIVDQARKELADIEVEIINRNSRIEELQSNKLKEEKDIKQNKIKLDIVSKIRELRERIGEANTSLAKQKAEYEKRESTVKAITKEETQLGVYRGMLSNKHKELTPLTTKLKQVQRDLIIIDDCTTRLKDVEEHFGTYKVIKDALDPKKGIPLFFIDNYLKDIGVRANKLLDIAYDGQFKIKFDISASDFFINVFKSDGTFLKDIGKASQGETSLTTVSLSLGMIERMMNTTLYNILYLDEVDSTLSTKNRRMFITLLEQQIEKLGIEQVFVISHNNEFDSHPVDLILLKENSVDTDDKEFMQNKSVIFKY